MDLNSLYYFVELTKDLNMTRTAERLFLSPQTLSNHIRRLEQELGTELFHRKPTLELTCAGESVLDFARTVKKEHDNLNAILSEIEQQERGVIRIGASTMFASQCLLAILPEYSKRFPNVELRLHGAKPDALEPLVLEGKVDFSIVARRISNAGIRTFAQMYNPVYLCVPDELLLQYYGSSAPEIKKRALTGVRMEDFARLPVCSCTDLPEEELAESFHCAGLAFKPYLNLPSVYMTTTFAFQGVAAAFTNHVQLCSRRGEIPENLNIFPMLYRGQILDQKISVTCRKDSYLPRYARTFQESLMRVMAENEQIPIARMV